MEYNLKSFNRVLNVKQLANVQYFELTNTFHTVQHAHDFYEMVYTDTGSVRAISEHFCGTIGEGEMILHVPNENHYLETDGETAPNVIIIGFSAEGEQLYEFCNKKVKLLSSEKKQLVEIIRETRSVYLAPYDVPYDADMKKRDDYPFGADQMIHLLLEQFLIKVIRNSMKIVEEIPGCSEGGIVYDITIYIQNNLTQPLGLKTLCSLFCINKTALCAAFKSTLNCTVVDYINSERIKKAKALMRLNKYTFTQIAEMLNFSSVHYLCKVFSKYEKMTPSAYNAAIKSKLGM